MIRFLYTEQKELLAQVLGVFLLPHACDTPVIRHSLSLYKITVTPHAFRDVALLSYYRGTGVAGIPCHICVIVFENRFRH